MNKEENNEKLSKRQAIEAGLNELYAFRFNTVKAKAEIDYTKCGLFRPIDDYTINTIVREMDAKLDLQVSKDLIKAIIESTYSIRINPVQHHLNHLQNYDPKKEKDYIDQFSSYVEVRNGENWQKYFKKWIVGMVANIMDDDYCKNHLCLVLTGAQRIFKTTYLELLVPKELRQYSYTGKLDPNNKDSQTYLAEYMLINIDDQLRELNKRDENQLKNLITINKVQYRRPYAAYIEEFPHLASFCASVNGNDFLTDPTGNRRFLPFEALKIYIDAAQAFDINNLYRQAMYLLKSGFTYWITPAEAEEQNQHNENFRVTSQEEELILEYFGIPEIEYHKQQANRFLSSTKLQSYLETVSGLRLSSKKLGEALVKLGFQQWQRREENSRLRVWSLIQKDANIVDHQNTRSAMDLKTSEIF